MNLLFRANKAWPAIEPWNLFWTQPDYVANSNDFEMCNNVMFLTVLALSDGEVADGSSRRILLHTHRQNLSLQRS